VNARSTCSTLLAALVLVACAASARAEAPAAPAPFAAPAAADPTSGVVPLAAEVALPLVAPPPSLGAADPEAPPLVGPSGSAKPARVPLAKRWWFWAGLGTAAVAVVLAAIFVGPKDPYSGNATPGTAAIF
jgi:hypothetical protein